MRSRHVLATLLLVAGGTAQAAADLVAVRVEGTARITRADGTHTLGPRGALINGDTVRLSGDSRISLQLAGRGLITLARGAELQVFDTRSGAVALGRLKLLSGTVRVDSRGKPAQDLRLNVGSLKARILGAEAIGANDAAGDTLCVLNGAIEIQTAGATDTRLDLPGSCLRRTPDGLLRNLRLEGDPSMSASLAATEIGVAPATTTAGARPAKPVPAPIIAPVGTPATAVASASPPAAPAGATTSRATGWTVVVLSLGKREPVEARTQSLLDQGLPATTRDAEVKGQRMYRVTVGEFSTQAEARDYSRNTLAKAGIEGWISPLF